MSTAKERFEAALDKALAGDNAFSEEKNPFAKSLKATRETEMEKGLDAWRDDPANVGKPMNAPELRKALEAQFDADQLPKLREKFKADTMAAYNGTPPADAAQEAASGVMNDLSKAAEHGIGSVMMGGDFGGAVSHTIRGSLFKMITSIPGVGKFLGQLMTWLGSKLNALFGGEKSMSWQEAGEKVGRDEIKKRLDEQVGKYADVNKLAAMVDEAAKEPKATPAAAAPARNAADVPIPPDVKPPGITGGTPATPDDHAVAPPPSTETINPELLRTQQEQGAAVPQ